MIGRLFSKLWRIINISRKIILNLIFFTLLILFFVAISSGEKEIKIPQGAALVLNLKGQLVEQKQEVNPMDAILAEAMEQEEENPEVLIADVLLAIEEAKKDDRITMIVLQLSRLQNSGLSKLQDIGKALASFRESGKEIIATGNNFSQSQYYLASYANEIWLNPKGWLIFEGFGRYQLYFKSALEKLAINQHIFRVGTYKSAVEPFMRDNMSEEAKEANQLWLNDLWAQYKNDVAEQRGFDVNNFDDNAEQLIAKITETQGDIAKYALANKWVDALKTNEEIRLALIEKVGSNKQKLPNNIGYKKYLNATQPAIAFDNPNTDKVAVVVAKGNILNGTQKAGTIGGQSTAKLLRKARFDNNVKAVVLRVDSPGGSAYASEVIRQEVELLKQSGKPVIASMGTYAASGGYWISASADKIVASPATITGSIGIFGLMMTFEESLSKLGVYTDGVGTTDLSGFGLTRPLDDNLGKIIQLTINHGYQEFISLVAENRNMTLAEVDKIAQGRVWSGNKALELGLVDELGNLSDAIKLAAEMAGLEKYDTKLIEKELSPFNQFLRDKFGQATSVTFDYLDINTQSPVNNLMIRFKQEMQQFNQFNDPNGAYAFCLVCTAE